MAGSSGANDDAWGLRAAAIARAAIAGAAGIGALCRTRGIPVVRSDRCGAWTWRPGGADDGPHRERDAAARYWHHRPRADGVNIATR
jgi:hypothetical protein